MLIIYPLPLHCKNFVKIKQLLWDFCLFNFLHINLAIKLPVISY